MTDHGIKQSVLWAKLQTSLEGRMAHRDKCLHFSRIPIRRVSLPVDPGVNLRCNHRALDHHLSCSCAQVEGCRARTGQYYSIEYILYMNQGVNANRYIQEGAHSRHWITPTTGLLKGIFVSAWVTNPPLVQDAHAKTKQP